MQATNALAATVALMLATGAAAQPDATLQARSTAAVRSILERLQASSRFPGAVAGAWLGEGAEVVVATGLADRDLQLPMPDSALLHAGSVGKTFFAALILQLVGEGRIGLDDKVSTYLGAEPWYGALPNANAVTVRMLLDHTSGMPELSGAFMASLIADPGRARTPLEAVRSVSGAQPVSPAGSAFAYTDVNYQLLQLLAERVTGRSAYEEIQRRLLDPLGLRRVVAARTKIVPGLVQGYAGEGSFMGFDAVLHEGALRLDPGFEGGGGGYAANAGDLARWIAYFMEGRAFPASLLPQVRQGVPAGQLDVGTDARAGLGIEMAETPLGMAYGHGGFFPGYLSLVLYYPSVRIAVALQVNSSAGDALSRPLRDVLLETAQALTTRRRGSPRR